MGLRIREHPERETLFEYAEQLESGRVSFGSQIAQHARDCAECAAELDTIRRSLSLTRLGSQTIEPTVALEASTILAMKSQRLEQRRQLRRRLVKSTAAAAVFMLTMSVTLSTSNAPRDSGVAKTYPTSGSAVPHRTYESLQAESREERLLEPAIMSSNWQPVSRWEHSQRRALDVLDDDIDEALAAYQANPALVRAGAVIDANRETKRRTLKSLYAQRNL